MQVLIEKLTKREIEVMQHVALAMPSKAIARKLGMSTNTVNTHVRSVCRKFDASGRWQALLIAKERGLG